jgi:hypothetical protein
MAAKKKPRVANSATKPNRLFKWWIGLGIVALVAVIGIAVVRFSNAAGDPNYPITGIYYGYQGGYDRYSRLLYDGRQTPVHRYMKSCYVNNRNICHLVDVDENTCWEFAPGGFKYQGHATIKMRETDCPKG